MLLTYSFCHQMHSSGSITAKCISISAFLLHPRGIPQHLFPPRRISAGIPRRPNSRAFRGIRINYSASGDYFTFGVDLLQGVNHHAPKCERVEQDVRDSIISNNYYCNCL